MSESPRNSPSSQRIAPTAAGARLVVLEGPGAGGKLRIDRDVIVLGRGDASHIQLVDPGLSRSHAEIRQTPDGLLLRDLGSSNGTFVNGTRVQQTALHPDDKIRLGPSVVLLLTLYDPIEDELLSRQRFEALGRMTAGVAHDVNNMLGAILANLEYLGSLSPAQRLGDSATRESLADMEKAADRAVALGRRLLGFASGASSEQRHIVLRDVVAEVSQLCRSTFDRRIAIHTQIDGDLQIVGSSLELHQVLMNLCLNARDAMPAGGSLHIEAAPAPGGELIQLLVRDTGTGMEAATLDRVFEPFFTTKRDGAGFGLGLASVRDLVTQLGGRIEVQSVLRRGTTFRMSFPAARRQRARATLTRMAGAPRTPLSGLRLLLVDDEDMVRRGARRLLCRAGHEVLEASSGEQALLHYRDAERRPDIVVLDLDMPLMSGEVVLDELLKMDAAATVVMVTGHVDPQAERRLRAAGARCILRKPCSGIELLDAITAAASEGPPQDDERPTYSEEP